MPDRPQLTLPDGWREIDVDESVVFSLPAMRVLGHTVVAEDETIRGRVREATDGTVDTTLRFVFATTLAFDPPIRPASSLSVIMPTVRRAAEREFEADLRDRGFTNVARGSRERTRRTDGTRINLRTYDATVDLGKRKGRNTEQDTDHDNETADNTDRHTTNQPSGEYACEGMLGVWHNGTDVALAGGAYLTEPIASIDVDPNTSRRELLDIIRTVEPDTDTDIDADPCTDADIDADPSTDA